MMFTRAPADRPRTAASYEIFADLTAMYLVLTAAVAFADARGG